MKLLKGILGLILGGYMVMGQAESAKVYYLSAFDIQSMYCGIITNGVESMDNIESTLEGRGYGTGATSSMLFMTNGENEIGVEVSSLNWFKEGVADTAKGIFDANAYCKLTLVKKDKQGKEELSHIDITIDKDGLPITEQSDGVTKREFQGVEVKKGFLPYDIDGEDENPLGMKIYSFSKKVQVNGLPEWAWTKATPYTDTPEQRKLLQQAYQELWDAFNQKDLKKIEQMYAITNEAFAYAKSSTPKEIFDDYDLKRRMSQKDFKMVPLDWNAYDVKLMNNGRMVRLRNKSHPSYSPVTYVSDDALRSSSPIFSLINGKFVIVI